MAIKDKYSLAYLIFYLLGLGSLLPWNFFITAKDYWMYKLGDCNVSEYNETTSPSNIPDNSTVYLNNSSSTTKSNGPSRNDLQSLFMNSLAVCAMLPNVLFQLLNTILQKRIPQNVRILSTLIAIIAIFIFTEVLVKTDTCTWQELFFTITLISVVVINSCGAVFQSSVFGLAAGFPQKYSGAVMAGQGVGGVFAALSMIVALAFSSDPTDSAFIFFLMAIVVIILTIFGYLMLTKLQFYKVYAHDPEDSNSNRNDFSLNTTGDYSEDKRFLSPDPNDDSLRVGMKNGGNPSTSLSGEMTQTPDAGLSSLIAISSKIALHMFCVTYTFFITLACFPAITGGIQSKTSGTSWTDIYFTPVTCFLLYNAADWIGRTTASYIHIPSPKGKITLLICVLARTVFPVLFSLCNFQPRNNLPIIFNEDWMYVVFMFLFAISNGHLSTLSMQYGPKQVAPEEATSAGSILAFMIAVGLFSGAGASFLVTSWI